MAQTQQYTSQLEIRYQLRLISWISLGMFLFMLFFLPFEHRELEFNNRLLFLVGLSAISFAIMGIFRIILPSTLERFIRLETYKISNEVVIVLMIWLFNSTAYIFYLRYVGLLELTLASGFKIVVFSAFPSIILKLADVNKLLHEQLRNMVGKNIKLGKFGPHDEEGKKPAEVFASETQKDSIMIHPDDLMLVKSADNYVNMVYKEGEEVKQKMLRKTITNIQSQLRKYPEFLRCHRSCILNTHYIINLTNSYKGYRLKLLDYEDEIPVSRQYLLAIKEYLNND